MKQVVTIEQVQLFPIYFLINAKSSDGALLTGNNYNYTLIWLAPASRCEPFHFIYIYQYIEQTTTTFRCAIAASTAQLQSADRVE